jgi:hypothetical protein
LNNVGAATLSTASLAKGTHSITAVYSGDGNYAAATSKALIEMVGTPANAPLVTPKAGSYTGSQVVKLSDDTKGAAIYYTIDGSQPTQYSKKYAGAFVVSKTATVRAVALALGYVESPVVSATYTIAP